MPHLIIDDRAVDVPEGTTVIEAAELAGIMIPRFCYLKVLGSVGACRMCAVSFLAGPVKGIAMSCMVKAADGMVVSTTSEEAVAFRRQVIEWLMVNHPLDCPVCDEGGQCLLQDETISGGHEARRYPGKKRTYPDQFLGPFIQHEMNRCIHCYRCVRFYQEYAGYRDFGVMQIGNRIYYGRFADGALESPFAGNLVDICPTGVFTDKTARYKARHWDMQHASTLCIHCCLGCNTTVNAFQQAIISQETRENEAVNGSFICDRGRFGGSFANHGERPRQPVADGVKVQWPQALDLAVARL
ncbi:MAG: 2Fe-2S iron-sulfur cluster-binding protein, partial [Desulfocapsaceae bacterium]|nr:2Fe-2S iron-sulfur cluster-binding protein [Desulfocapsaceae bacterium]